jgi:hypothetical protein
MNIALPSRDDDRSHSGQLGTRAFDFQRALGYQGALRAYEMDAQSTTDPSDPSHIPLLRLGQGWQHRPQRLLDLRSGGAGWRFDLNRQYRQDEGSWNSPDYHGEAA